MNQDFMLMRQDLLNILDTAIDKYNQAPRYTVEDHADLRGKVQDLKDARERVLSLIIIADLV